MQKVLTTPTATAPITMGGAYRAVVAAASAPTSITPALAPREEITELEEPIDNELDVNPI
ncbi:unnamed protein product [Orchesella dallaii]|uniref:Uncharacterized protein n=1 Tax=Orchesella dallaii TaxID=48710 RepID=A0ABP1R1W1_9HEXA